MRKIFFQILCFSESPNFTDIDIGLVYVDSLYLGDELMIINRKKFELWIYNLLHLFFKEFRF